MYCRDREVSFTGAWFPSNYLIAMKTFLPTGSSSINCESVLNSLLTGVSLWKAPEILNPKEQPATEQRLAVADFAKRLGVRQFSAAFQSRPLTHAKVPEAWRSPRPGG